MTQKIQDELRGFVDEAKHLTTNLNLFVSDMIRDQQLVHQLDHEPDQLALKYSFSKTEIMIIDVELIPSVAILHMTGITNIYIQPAIIIYIRHHYSCTPHAVLLHT